MNAADFPKITVILRGYTYSQIKTVAEVLSKSRIRSMEITMNTPESLETIKKISREFGDKLLIGAGTVTTLKEAMQSVEAGAKFILSPVMMEEKTIEYCKQKGVLTVPGAYTPTEIFQSFRQGADIVKVFPAGILGFQYIKDIRAPLGDLNLMVVGGINSNNVAQYFDCGAKCAGIASGIFDKSHIIQENREELEKSIHFLEEKLAGRL